MQGFDEILEKSGLGLSAVFGGFSGFGKVFAVFVKGRLKGLSGDLRSF